MSSDMHFDNPHALPPEKVKVLDGEGYVALEAVILIDGMLCVNAEAEVSEALDAEHTIAIHRDEHACTIALTENQLASISKSDDKPAGTPYLKARIDNRDQE